MGPPSLQPAGSRCSGAIPWSPPTSPSAAPPDTMLKVGLTGGIASGKSHVASVFAGLGVHVSDADRISRSLTAPDQPGLAALAQALGKGILDTQGGLDRAALRRRIFTDPDLRQ